MHFWFADKMTPYKIHT